MDVSRSAAINRGVRLEAITIAWVVIEAAVAIGAGVVARSVLLIAFGADSVIELLSGVALYRWLSGRSREVTTTRLSAVLLVLLCAYVVLSSIAGLVLRVVPEVSIAGIAVAAIAVAGMPLLARAKRGVNRVLNSPSLRADIAETIGCAYLAAVTLAGLVVSMLTGWWWTQYVASMALLIWLVPEAREALEHWRDNGPEQGGETGNE
jgi:divalent metal cation (Fe/Co/Zn/Cd) transporter